MALSSFYISIGVAVRCLDEDEGLLENQNGIYE